MAAVLSESSAFCRYPLVSIEDPFDQDHWDAYTEIVKEPRSCQS